MDEKVSLIIPDLDINVHFEDDLNFAYEFYITALYKKWENQSTRTSDEKIARIYEDGIKRIDLAVNNFQQRIDGHIKRKEGKN